MIRNIIAIVIGTSIGGTLIAAGMFAFNLLYPSVETRISSDEFEGYIQSASTMNQISLVFSWALCGFIAACVTTVIQGRTDFKPVLVSVGILQLITYMTMLMMPKYSIWTWLSVTVLYISVGLIAYRLLRKEDHAKSM